MPQRKTQEIKRDEDLENAKGKVLADLLGKKAKAKKDWSNRKLSLAERVAFRQLESGTSFEVVMRTVQYGDDSIDPFTKQVKPFAKQKGLIVTLELEPEDPGWIEHLMKALQNTQLNKKEIELFKKHIMRLNYQGALRDHYEFYGLSIRELEEKEREYREEGVIKQADRLKKVIERNK